MIDLSALKDDAKVDTKDTTKDDATSRPTPDGSSPSTASATIDLSELKKSAPPPQASDRQGIQSPVSGTVERVTGGYRQAKEALTPKPEQPYRNPFGRAWEAAKGAGEIASAPFYPFNYLGQQAGEGLTRSSGEMTDQALDARIAQARRLKAGPAAGASAEVNELPMLERLRAMPYEQRVRVSREAMGSGIEGGVQLAMPPGLVRGAVRAVPRLLGRAGKTAEVAGESAVPLKLRPELAVNPENIQGPLRPGGAYRIETIPPKARPGVQQTLDRAQEVLSGTGTQRQGVQRTLDAAQDLQTGRSPLDLGEAGRRMTAQRGAYKPEPVPADAEQRFVEQLAQETGVAPKGPRPTPETAPTPAVQGPLRAVEPPNRGKTSALRETFAPASLSRETGDTASIIRTRLGEQARERAVTASLFKNVERVFDGMPMANRHAFIDQMEHGGAQAGRALTETAQGFRKALDEKWAEVVKLNPKAAEDYIENYFPHLWENDRAAAVAYANKRAPVTGPTGFLKERELPTVQVGLRAGLKLKDDNPARLVAQRLADMDRYIAGQKVIQDLQESGLARAFKAGEEVTSGWQRMPGTIPNSSGLYVPQDVALIMDRWLAPGLSGNRLFDTARSVGNSMNQFQLGFSAFHLFFTSMDAMASRMALGFKELATPGMRLKGVKDVALGISPTTAWTNAMEGNRVLKAYLRKPGFEQFNHLADAVVKAGGRATMDPFYRTGPLARGHFDQTMLGQFSSGLHNAAEKISAGGKALVSGRVPTATAETVRAVGETMSAVSDLISYPIMQKIVPAQKLGVFSKMAEYEIAKLGPKATDRDVAQALQRAWDSVDNRMGQMVYDNLFWNKTLKDSMMLATRSVGWNAGTIREIGGGVGEYLKVPLGKQREFTHKMAYVAAFPIVAATYGAITQYLMTGHGPTELKDYFAPRTGKIFPDGRPERVQLATYMRDVMALTKGMDFSPMAPIKAGENLFEMGKHKVHPLWQSLFEMMTNEDFYGAAIRDPKDPELKQFTDSLIFLAEQWTPLGIRQLTGLGQMPAKPGFERSYPGLSLVGITPAPAAIERSAEQQAAVQQKIDRMKLARKKQREGVR